MKKVKSLFDAKCKNLISTQLIVRLLIRFLFLISFFMNKIDLILWEMVCERKGVDESWSHTIQRKFWFTEMFCAFISLLKTVVI